MKLTEHAFRQLRNFRLGPYRNFNKDKKQLIDYTFSCCRPVPDSFADLGGIWNVDGAYTFYTLSKFAPGHAFLIDTDFTEASLKKSQRITNLKILQGNFGEESVAEQIGKVDAIFLFDVLLHQVKPDWDEVLEMYSKRTNYFLVFNPQWTGSDKTIRLFDLGQEGYFKNVPHTEDHPVYKDLFEKMNEIHPLHKRIWKDLHNVWQWGITDHDLLVKMEELGYKMKWNKNCGRFGSLTNFENHAFVFQKI
jgi:hypothetical protein